MQKLIALVKSSSMAPYLIAPFLPYQQPSGEEEGKEGEGGQEEEGHAKIVCDKN